MFVSLFRTWRHVLLPLSLALLQQLVLLFAFLRSHRLLEERIVKIDQVIR